MTRSLEGILKAIALAIFMIPLLINPAFADDKGGVISVTLLSPYVKNSESYGFELVLDSDDIDGSYGGLLFRNGRASFALSEGESMTVCGIPHGMGYQVYPLGDENTLFLAYQESGYPVTKNRLTVDAGNASGITFVAVSLRDSAELEIQTNLDPILNGDPDNLRLIGLQGTDAAGTALDILRTGYKTYAQPLKIRANSFDAYGEKAQKHYAYRIMEEGEETDTVLHFRVSLEKGNSLSTEDDAYTVAFSVESAEETIAEYEWSGTGFYEISLKESGNRYSVSAQEGRAVLTLTGDFMMLGRAAEAHEFTWKIEENNQTVSTGFNERDGKIRFESIEYTKTDVGLHVYKVSQIQKESSDVTYDPRNYYVSVLVTSQKGKLSATVLEMMLEGENAEELHFENKYALIDFTIYTLWQGGEESGLTFILYANGEPMKPQPEWVTDGSVYVFENLPMYDRRGRTIQYSARELYFDSYMAMYLNTGIYEAYTKMLYNGGTVVNRKVQEFSFRLRYEGKTPEETLPYRFLLFDGDELYYQNTQPEKDAYGRMTYRFLPARINRHDALYSVKLNPIPGYLVSYENRGDYAGVDDKVYDGGVIHVKEVPLTAENDYAADIGHWLLVFGTAGMLFCLVIMHFTKTGRRELDC